MAVPREDHPSQSLGHNRRSAVASSQVEHRNLGGNKLSDQLEEEPQYQSARRYSRSHCCWLGCHRFHPHPRENGDGRHGFISLVGVVIPDTICDFKLESA